MSDSYPKYDKLTVEVGVGYDAAEIEIIVFSSGGEPIGWCSRTSSGKGQPSNKVEDFLHIGGLCFLNGLFMRNISYWWAKNILTPHDLTEYVKQVRPEWISHGQFESKQFNKIARMFDIVFTVVHDRLDIQGPSTYGNPRTGVQLNAVTLKGSHYVVDGLDKCFTHLACSSCTFENQTDAKNCIVCGFGFGSVPPCTLVCPPSVSEQRAPHAVRRPTTAPAQRQVAAPAQRPAAAPAQRQAAPAAPAPPTEIECKACTFLNPVGTVNCEVCGTNTTFTPGGRDITRLG